jgi:AcrR family transcriptional regulator
MEPTGRRARKKLDTEKSIVETAMSLFRKNSYALTTMEQIAETADIAKATLYRYFPVKEAILVAHWQHKSEEALRKAPAFFRRYRDTRSRLKAYLKMGLTEAMESRELFSAYFSYRMQNFNNPELSRTLNSGFNRMLSEILTSGVENAELRADVSIPVLSAQFELSASMLFVNWMREPEAINVNKSISTIVDIYLNGAGLQRRSAG